MGLIPYGLDETTKQGRPAVPGDVLVAPDGTFLSTGYAIVLDSTATNADINAALASFNIVYLKPGTYSSISAAGPQIVLPKSKQLIGLTSGTATSAADSFARPELPVTGTTAASLFRMEVGSALKNLRINGAAVTVASSSHHAVEQTTVSADAWCVIEEVDIVSWGGGAAGLNVGRSYIRGGEIRLCGRGVLMRPIITSGVQEKIPVLERCIFRDNASGTIDFGSSQANGWRILRCIIDHATPHGVSLGANTTVVEIAQCFFDGNGAAATNGIEFPAAADDHTRIQSNYFLNYGGAGSLPMNLATPVGSRRALASENTRRNSNAFVIPGGWTFINNLGAT